MRYTLSSLAILFTLLTAFACGGPERPLFKPNGKWHETQVIFRNYENGVLAATDTTTTVLASWTFKRNGKGTQVNNNGKVDFQWEANKDLTELQICLDNNSALVCTDFDLEWINDDALIMRTVFQENAANYTEADYFLARED